MKAAVLSGKAEDLLPGVADASVDAVVQAALLGGFRCIAMDSWPDAIAHARVRLAAYEETGEVVFG